MIKIIDFAKAQGVTYEAVRRQVARYREELGSHVVKKGRVSYLDDEAVSFLEKKRKENPVIVYEQGKNDEIEALRNENNALKIKLLEIQDQLIQSTQKTNQLLEEQGRYLVAIQDKQYLEKELAELKEESASFKPIAFGLYRKITPPTVVQDGDQTKTDI